VINLIDDELFKLAAQVLGRPWGRRTKEKGNGSDYGPTSNGISIY
jgi:hypothetical protein